MEERYKEAFVEISEILKLMPNTILNKIPKSFRDFIENEKFTTYVSNIKEPLEQCELREETIIILSLIYRDFLCDEKEKARLQYRDAYKIKEAEDQLREKYNIDKLLNNNKNNNVEKNNNSVEEKSLTVIEKKWYKEIFNIVKKIFRKNEKKEEYK